ncbi:MAG: hypothetical protein QF926_11590 [Alphaproteobacteria bacterium]|jgi:hypothetical protein|nr:hypothetical protein [Alphaproteobacteria bacterium]MDP6517248.1 hypothetical protein [Alphaproteobacteria bacterium]|tara:strand:- start:447 stop:596 length:150 start_codon:yes stop_codon:yes gene_type:complete
MDTTQAFDTGKGRDGERLPWRMAIVAWILFSIGTWILIGSALAGGLAGA